MFGFKAGRVGMHGGGVKVYSWSGAAILVWWGVVSTEGEGVRIYGALVIPRRLYILSDQSS